MMKNRIFNCMVLIMVTFTTTITAQTANNHPTVDQIKIKYQAVTQGTTTTTLGNIQVVPQGTITLKTTVNVKKIHFKIQGINTNTIYYQVNYNLDSSPVYSNGIKLYENNNGSVYISSGQALQLKPYYIKVQTEDTLQNLSPVFTITQ